MVRGEKKAPPRIGGCPTAPAGTRGPATGTSGLHGRHPDGPALFPFWDKSGAACARGGPGRRHPASEHRDPMATHAPHPSATPHPLTARSHSPGRARSVPVGSAAPGGGQGTSGTRHCRTLIKGVDSAGRAPGAGRRSAPGPGDYPLHRTTSARTCPLFNSVYPPPPPATSWASCVTRSSVICDRGARPQGGVRLGPDVLARSITTARSRRLVTS